MTDSSVVFPGSFDPPTAGHLHVIERASALFPRVVVAVGHNPRKRSAFTVAERLRMLEQATAHLDNVTIKSFSGLLVDFLKQNDAHVLLKGLRRVEDFANEWQQARANRALLPGVETVFLISDAHLMYFGSTLVREVAHLGGNTRGLVSDDIQAQLEKQADPWLNP